MKKLKSVHADQPQLAAGAPMAPVDLTPDEIAVLTHFRNMDDRSQAFMLRIMPSHAERCPRRAGSALRLVVGGLK